MTNPESLKSSWYRYCADIGLDQLTDCELAFYAGAWAVLSTIAGVAAERDETAAAETFNGLMREALAYKTASR